MVLCVVAKKKQHNVGFPTFKLLPSPVKYYFSWFRHMLPRLKDRLLLSIYFTSALLHKNSVAMKYRWICKILILSESPPLFRLYYMYVHTYICVCVRKARVNVCSLSYECYINMTQWKKIKHTIYYITEWYEDSLVVFKQTRIKCNAKMEAIFRQGA